MATFTTDPDNKTVEADYFAAMSRIEQRLALPPEPEETLEPVMDSERGQLRALAEQLFAAKMSVETRLEIAAQICGLLEGDGTQVDWIPPPISVKVNAIN